MPTIDSKILELNGVWLQRDKATLIEDVSWSVCGGEHWGILGANGSGKTTLLRLITGYLWPSRGSIAVLGEDFGRCDLHQLRTHIGWVSQSLDQQMAASVRVRQVVLSGLEATIGVYRRFSEAEEGMAQEAMERLKIVPLASRRFGTLSQGERQKTLIARALVLQPLLLILDEPCAGLDPVARREFLEQVGALANSPDCPVLILVTHHVEELGPWVSHVLLMKKGKVLDAGGKEVVLNSTNCSEVFDARLELERTRNEYRFNFPY